MEIYKKCSRCGNEYPATTEYFHRSKRERDGLKLECKACRHQYAKKQYAKKLEQDPNYNKKFYAEMKEKHYERELERQTKWREDNRERYNKRLREWRKGSEKYKAYIKKYQQENKVRIAENQRRYTAKKFYEMLKNIAP